RARFPGQRHEAHHQAVGADPGAGFRIAPDLLTARDADQRLAEIDAAERGIHRLANAGIGIDIRGAGRRIVEIVEHQGPVPGEMPSEPLQMFDDEGMSDAGTRPGAATDALRASLVTVGGDEASLLEDRLGHAKGPRGGLLNQKFVPEALQYPG